MSKLAELSYDIEQLYIEGFSPKGIAAQLGCPLALIYDWLEENSMGDQEESVADQPQPNLFSY